MHYYWDWWIFPLGGYQIVDSFFGTLLSGLLLTLVVAAVAWLPAIVFGLVLGSAVSSPVKIVQSICRLWTKLLCATPLFVQVFVWNFVVPNCLAANTTDWFCSPPNQSLLASVACVASYGAARIALQTAKADNRPVATSRLPSILVNESVVMIQSSCIGLTIGIINQMVATGSLRQLTMQTLEACSAAVLVYVLISTLVAAAIRTLHNAYSASH